MTPGRCPHCGRTDIVWSRDRIIAALQDWEAKHGTAPASDLWEKAGPGHPSNETVRNMFGTVAAARAEAGVTFRRKNSAGEWDRDAVIQAVFRWRFLHDRLPTQREWQSPMPGWPTVSVCRRLFGSWNGTFVGAGFTPTHARRSPKSYRASMAAVTKAAA